MKIDWSRPNAIRRLVKFAAAGAMLGVLLLGFNLPLASPAPTFSLNVINTSSKLSTLGDGTRIILMFHNGLDWASGADVREANGNSVTITEVDVSATLSGSPLFTLTVPASTSSTFSLLSNPQTVSRTTTSAGYYEGAGLWQTTVLPGETTAIWYTGWTVGCGEGTGTHLWTFTVHFHVLGSSTSQTLTETAKFKVTQSFPNCVEGSVSDNSNGVAISGASVSLVDLTTSTTTQVMTTSSNGFYFSTASLTVGHSYQVAVTALPAPYTSATEWNGNSQPFTWTGSTVDVMFAAS